MKCTYRQFQFDTDDMRSFHTGVKTLPTIFVNVNGLCFAQANRAKWENPVIRHLSQVEILRLAEAYQLPEIKKLLDAIRHRQGGNSMPPDVDPPK